MRSWWDRRRVRWCGHQSSRRRGDRPTRNRGQLTLRGRRRNGTRSRRRGWRLRGRWRSMFRWSCCSRRRRMFRGSCHSRRWRMFRGSGCGRRWRMFRRSCRGWRCHVLRWSRGGRRRRGLWRSLRRGGGWRFRRRRGGWFRWRCTRLFRLSGLGQFNTPPCEHALSRRRIAVRKACLGFLERDDARNNRACQEQTKKFVHSDCPIGILADALKRAGLAQYLAAVRLHSEPY